MKQVNQIAGSLFIALTLSGCSTSPQETGPKPVIKSIAVVPASNPQKVILENTNVLSGFSFGNAAAHRNDTQMKESTLNSLMNISDTRLGESLTTKVVENLRSAGFQVEIITNIQRPSDYPDNIDIRTVPHAADAVMQLSITYAGIYSGATSTTFNPQIAGYALLYPKGSKRAIFNNEVAFGTALADGKPTEIKAGAKFAYQGISSVYGNSVELRGFYVTGTDLVAKRLSEQLIAALR